MSKQRRTTSRKTSDADIPRTTRRRSSSRTQQTTWTTVLAIVILLIVFWLFPELREPGDTVPDTQPDAAQTTAPDGGAPPPDGGEQATANLNMALGNPTNAAADVNVPDNFLIPRDQYVLSYNRDGGIPNWVSWHLSTADMGETDRSDFQPDPSLPEDWYRVRPSDYTNSGYDRGHMAPSADRTVSEADNLPLFYMTNIVPQAPDNNQGPWVDLEEYSRDLARAGNELYIVSGVRGSQGALKEGRITIPASVWKVMLVLPEGDNDIARITDRTEVIAVDMPNQQGIRDNDWREYLTSVDAIEQRTGYDFFSNVDPTLQQVFEAAAP